MLRTTLLTMALVLLASSVIQATSPSLQAVRPPGGQRGTELEINLTGERLGDTQEVLFYQSGLTVTELEVVDDSHVKATVQIAPECRLGLYDLRLRTTSGISELRTFSIGALPEIDEDEPNDDFDNPQPIPMNVTVNGVAANEDVDYYVVEAKKGERITAEVEGIRLGIVLFDPYVAILDERRFELASSDDEALVWQDPIASIIAPEDGKYIIEVRESAYAGNNNCLYRLHVGHFPRPRATVPAGGPPGETVEVRWIGDLLGETTTPISLPSDTELVEFAIQAQDDQGIAPYPNAFRLSALENVLEVEPNDDHDTATPFTAPAALNGVIEEPGDEDFFVFSAEKDQAFEIQVFARQLRSPLDSVLYVAHKGGRNLERDDDSNGPDSAIRFTAPEDGEYVIRVHDHLSQGGPEFFYRIEVTPVEPQLRLSPVTESMRRRTGAIAAAVPRGNRQAILINASRQNFGGALQVAAEGLPEGMTLEAGTMDPGVATMPVLFTAEADAPEAGALITMTGQLVESDQAIPSRFQHTAELVLGQNNVPFWTRSVDRLAVAVTDDAPFTIEVVEPKVPLVRGGTMELKVVAHRDEGCTDPIAVSLPWNPPGIGSAGNISIEEGEDEAVIPINANDNAALNTWKIVVNGTADAGQGPFTVSSQLADLTIAERFVSFEFQSASVEQGQAVDLFIDVTQLADFEGEAEVSLIGLPHNVTAEPQTITKDTTELAFRIQTREDSPAGNHKNLFCQAVILQEGEPIVHNLGSGRLRIDEPLEVDDDSADETAASVAANESEDSASERPLSRLEKLRQEARQRAEARAAGKEDEIPSESDASESDARQDDAQEPQPETDAPE